MASPASVNLTLVRGDDESVVVLLTTPTGPIDLTGRTYRAEVRANRTLVGTPAGAFVCSVPTPATGEIVMFMGSLDTDSLDSNVKYWWDLEETVGGQVNTLLIGRVTVIQDVSHA